MSNNEVVDQYNPRFEIGSIIQHASVTIKNEFTVSTNSWMACYGSKIFQIETALAIDPDVFWEEERERAKKNIEKIKEELVILKKTYDGKIVPPQELQEQLLSRLDVFRNEEVESNEK